MTLRKEEPAEISRRMLRVPLEMAYAARCDYIILNNELDTAADTLHAIVVAERARRSTRSARLSYTLPDDGSYVIAVTRFGLHSGTTSGDFRLALEQVGRAD